MISKLDIKYKDDYYIIYIDEDELNKLAEEAILSLHKAKPVFPYWRLIYCNVDEDRIRVLMERKMGHEDCEINWSDLDIILHHENEDFILNSSDSSKAFPNNLTHEERITLQKYIINKTGDHMKEMIADDGKPTGARDGEYKD